jgi:hypothetical protein
LIGPARASRGEEEEEVQEGLQAEEGQDQERQGQAQVRQEEAEEKALGLAA